MWVKGCFILIVLVLFFGTPAGAISYSEFLVQAPGQDVKTETIKKLNYAFAQHEMIMLLIQNKNFAEVLPEVVKILELNLPPKYEERVAKSLVGIAYKLLEVKQSSLGHKVLDEGLRSLSLNGNKANILRFKAILYKEEGELEAAIETFRRANELEREAK